MLKYAKITEERIRRAVPEILATCTGPGRPVEVAAWQAPGEPVPPDEAFAAAYAPFSVGDSWGPKWGTTWFRVRGEIPAEWSGNQVALHMRLADWGREGFTAEGLVYLGDRILRALNIFRNDIPLTEHFPAGSTFELFVEAAANASDCDESLVKVSEGLCFRMTQAEVACRFPERFAFYYDYVLMADAMATLPETAQRRAELRHALNEALNAFDLARPGETVAAARSLLAPLLARRNGETVHKLSAIGHAHIDTAWMWPLREAIRKCARTFSTALDYMREYPEYIFGCSQAQHYAWMKHRYPQVFEGIRRAVAAGQWEPLGSMWVEMDCNLASGESLVRQILKGKAFFRREFGYETRDAWIPDVFGYAASLPQIFRKCGIDYFVTQKISWNQFTKFPHHSFYWEGIDGTRVFTHFPPADTYNAEVDARSLVHNVDNFREHGTSDRSLYIYGYGDGGGGPTIEMLERIRRLGNFDQLPIVTPQKVSDFLPLAEEGMSNIPVWVGELYLELHRGTYTSQARTKRNNRQCEFLLRDAEMIDAVRSLLVPDSPESAADPPRAIYDVSGLGEDAGSHTVALDRAWKLVLLNQFHDIIPGSSIGWVYEDAERDHATVRALCASIIDPSLQALDGLPDCRGMQRPVRVVNTLGWARREVIEVEGEGLRVVSAPACGYAVFDAAAPGDDGSPTVAAAALENSLVLENGLLRAEIDAAGLLVSLRDLREDREVIAPGERGNLFQLHPDKPNTYDAWDIDIFYQEKCEDLAGDASCEVLENGPLRAVVRVERSFGNSWISQRIIMRANSARLDFETEMEWRERHALLKVAFPVAVRSARATYEIQYGHVERPTHYNTTADIARFEVCAHKWADLSETGYGVALINDCKYGYDIHGHTMRLSLLRAPTSPDKEADQGRHVFTYSLYPHRGDACSGRVIEEAYELNVSLRVAPLDPARSGAAGREGSWFAVDRPGVVIEAVKRAENGPGVIVRLYESHGARGGAVLSTSLPFTQASLTSPLEDADTPIPLADGEVRLDVRPFEIITLRFR